MRVDDVLALREHFPEAPEWVVEREWSLAAARNAMIKLRLLHPERAPMTAERALGNALYRKLKGDTR